METCPTILFSLFRIRIKTFSWVRDGPTPDYTHLLHPDIVDGIHGPWVLLDGFIQESSETDRRDIFTFLRGLLVSANDLKRAQSEFQRRIYPGNDAIPRAWEDHFTFGGEIPWSRHFGSHLRVQDGRHGRHLAEAFESYKTKKVRKRVPAVNLRAVTPEAASYLTTLLPKIIFIPGGATGPAPEQDSKYYYTYHHKKLPGVTVEIPIHIFSWSSQSPLNKVSGIHLPTPAICNVLKASTARKKLGSFGSQ